MSPTTKALAQLPSLVQFAFWKSSRLIRFDSFAFWCFFCIDTLFASRAMCLLSTTDGYSQLDPAIRPLNHSVNRRTSSISVVTPTHTHITPQHSVTTSQTSPNGNRLPRTNCSQVRHLHALPFRHNRDQIYVVHLALSFSLCFRTLCHCRWGIQTRKRSG